MAKERESTYNLTNTIIGKGSVLDGSFQIEHDITIYATLKGELTCTGMVVVGESGRLEANTRAKDAIITGKVIGNLEVSNKVVLKSKAVLVGDLKAGLLVVEEGAVFQGSCESGADAELPGEVPEEKARFPVPSSDEEERAQGL